MLIVSPTPMQTLDAWDILGFLVLMELLKQKPERAMIRIKTVKTSAEISKKPLRMPETGHVCTFLIQSPE